MRRAVPLLLTLLTAACHDPQSDSMSRSELNAQTNNVSDVDGPGSHPGPLTAPIDNGAEAPPPK